MPKAKVLVFGDLHAGAVYAPAPPHFNTGSDKYSKVRKELWATIAMMKAFGPTHIITGGDMVDGHQSKQSGIQCITTDCGINWIQNC